MIDSKSMNLDELSTATRDNLRSLGYGNRTICMVNRIWRDLEQFLKNRSKSPFLPVYGLEYLHERIGYPECLQRELTPDERDYIRAVRMLTSFQESGEIPKGLKRNRTEWYEPIRDIRNHYIQHCEETYKTRATQRSRIAAADRFMRIVVVNKQTAWEDISINTISEYVMGLAEYAKATVEVHLRGLRFFLQFLYEEEIVKQDYTASVPKMCCSTGERIPHMLSTEQVNTLLKSIDRGNPVGKRNYAIIVIAACLGMRDSDITNLKFENINWERSEISFFQKKTNRFLTLPLLPVVGEGIIDYLRYGRPQTDSKYVFVKHRPPFQQTASFYSVMRIVLENSGVKVTGNFPKGLHILRHSLASELIRQGESYNTVSTILGHASIGSTNAYTHIDIDGLFKCALELTRQQAMNSDLNFNSQFSDCFCNFILEKRGLGCKYETEAAALRLFDRYVCESGYVGTGISKALFENWTNRRPYEREKTCESRTHILSQFCKYIIRTGGQAYIPPSAQRLHRDISYRPYIFTNEELLRFLESTKRMPGSTQRKTVFYMLFSLLICTGLRLGEAMRLRWANIDWDSAPMMVSIIGAKFDKDRVIPLADSLSQQLKKYREEMTLLFPGCEYLFPSRHNAPYSQDQVYITFRRILWDAGISHGGRGKGPRIHDFRHSFAVKSLRKMVYSQEDIMAVVPLLSQYLGHKNIYATQSYLQFTADMFPYVTETMQNTLGNVIPGMEEYDEETH